MERKPAKPVPPEVSYLPEDSVVRNIPMRFLVQPVLQQKAEWEKTQGRLLGIRVPKTTK